MKKVWITALVKMEKEIQQLMKSLTTYGLKAEGHFWKDDLQNAAWTGAREELLTGETAAWIIVGRTSDFSNESIRYGLSLLAITLHAHRGNGFPTAVVAIDGDLPAGSLPTPLGSAQVLSLSNPTLGVKIVSLANMPAKSVKTEYRLDVYGIPGLGAWLEVGPASGCTWKGAMLGVCGAEIAAHGVGPAGKLPDRCILEYPMQGMKIQHGDKEYNAWAVQNELDEGSSYYVSVRDYPSSILFGALPGEQEGEAYVATLK
jgi:hypothetical protein